MKKLKTIVILLILIGFWNLSIKEIQAQSEAEVRLVSNNEVSDLHFEISKHLDIFVSLIRELNSYYVDEIEPADLIKTGITSLLKSLDPYTNYIPESDAEDYRFMTTGNYGGIGALIGVKGNYVQITEPYVGFPAFNSGFRAGDVLKEIDGKSIKGKSTSEVSTLLRGEPGTEVMLLYDRPGIEGSLEKTIIRAKIHIDNVTYSGMLNDSIGYVKLTAFKINASRELKKSINELKKNEQITGLVLDLRSNPGGLLHEAVRIVGLFVEKSEHVVSTKGKVDVWNKEYNTYDKPLDKEIPLIVVVDGRSASASEIVAGALQDLDRAVIVGQRTFGKGLVQTTRKLSYNAQLKVTTSKYYIPSGRCIQALDYSHKDENGRAIKIPDSLISEFKTRNGRLVYDGAGITPDIKVDDPKVSDLLRTLITQGLIFDYVTLFRNKNDSIMAPKEFNISEAEYKNFIAFVKEKEFDYQSSTEKALAKLKKEAEKNKYFEFIKDEYDSINAKLKDYKEKELIIYREEIEKMIKNEIVSRYYYQKGRILASLEDDPDIEKAIEILSDPEEYNKILSQIEKDDKKD